nr:MAG TPA: hypothetical protein [Caudoviricetes sp.]
MVALILLIISMRSFASMAVYSFSGSEYKKPYFSINSICLSMSPLGRASSFPRMFFSCRPPATPVIFKPSFAA